MSDHIRLMLPNLTRSIVRMNMGGVLLRSGMMVPMMSQYVASRQIEIISCIDASLIPATVCGVRSGIYRSVVFDYLDRIRPSYRFRHLTLTFSFFAHPSHFTHQGARRSDSTPSQSSSPWASRHRLHPTFPVPVILPTSISLLSLGWRFLVYIYSRR